MNNKLNKISPYLAKSLGMSVEALAQSFQPAGGDDLDELVRFRQALFSGDAPWDDKRYLQWRYSFDGDVSGTSCMWVFKMESKIVGCLGIETVDLCSSGSLIPATKAMDILVDPALDGRGLGAWMNLYLMSIYPVMIVVGSNDKSHSLIIRLFHQLSHIKKYKLPIRSRYFLQKGLRSSLLSGIVSVPFDMLLYLRRKLQWRKSNKKVVTRELNEIPGEVNRLKAASDDFVYVNRSADYLNWRYIANPRRKFTLIGMFGGLELVGIAVCREYYSELTQQNEAIIFDWLCLDDESGAGFSTLIQQSASFLLDRGACTINLAVYCGECDGSLRKLGFIERDVEAPFFIYVKDEELKAKLCDETKWFLTEGDSDTDMY